MILTDAASSLCPSLELRGEPVIFGWPPRRHCVLGGRLSWCPFKRSPAGCRGVIWMCSGRCLSVHSCPSFPPAPPRNLPVIHVCASRGAPRHREGQSACPAAEATDVRTCFSPAPTTHHQAVWLSLPSASCAASLSAPGQRPGPAHLVPKPGGGCGAQSSHHEPLNPRQALCSCKTARWEKSAGTVQAA